MSNKYSIKLKNLRSGREVILDSTNKLTSANKSFTRAKKRLNFFTIAKQELKLVNNETNKVLKSWKGKAVPKRLKR